MRSRWPQSGGLTRPKTRRTRENPASRAWRPRGRSSTATAPTAPRARSPWRVLRPTVRTATARTAQGPPARPPTTRPPTAQSPTRSPSPRARPSPRVTRPSQRETPRCPRATRSSPRVMAPTRTPSPTRMASSRRRARRRRPTCRRPTALRRLRPPSGTASSPAATSSPTRETCPWWAHRPRWCQTPRSPPCPGRSRRCRWSPRRLPPQSSRATSDSWGTSTSPRWTPSRSPARRCSNPASSGSSRRRPTLDPRRRRDIYPSSKSAALPPALVRVGRRLLGRHCGFALRCRRLGIAGRRVTSSRVSFGHTDRILDASCFVDVSCDLLSLACGRDGRAARRWTLILGMRPRHGTRRELRTQSTCMAFSCTSSTLLETSSRRRNPQEPRAWRRSGWAVAHCSASSLAVLGDGTAMQEMRRFNWGVNH
mmetsp:Transcript_6006/g.20471  ORF Transcript_6006/g.20471 Transcript_6006/m.20471 type:complete len:425 (+) Transcript_6006:450-1724(+)